MLVVRGTKVTEAMLAAGQFSLVVRAGAGYNTIDVKAASARGIYVSNCPGKNSIAVAELAFALILALDRRLADNVVDLRQANGTRKNQQGARTLRPHARLGWRRTDRSRNDPARATPSGCTSSPGAAA